MNEKDKKAILRFMRLTFYTLHPHYCEYPLAEMKTCYECFGDESEQFNNFAPYLQRAFFMDRTIEKLEGEK